MEYQLTGWGNAGHIHLFWVAGKTMIPYGKWRPVALRRVYDEERYTRLPLPFKVSKSSVLLRNVRCIEMLCDIVASEPELPTQDHVEQHMEPPRIDEVDHAHPPRLSQ